MPEETIEESIKVVGRRSPTSGGLPVAEAWLRAVVALRRHRRFIPRGVHRFETFEEAHAWSIRMMARR